jgi:hypothetical protein
MVLSYSDLLLSVATA